MSEYENGGDGLEEALGKELENLDSQLERIDREVGEIAVRLDHLRNGRYSSAERCTPGRCSGEQMLTSTANPRRRELAP